jgi:hypothetical protein
MGDWFASGAGRCRIDRADRLLTESAALPFPGARVKPDVAVLDLTFVCESTLGSPARSREVLPLDTFVLLRSSTGQAYAPRARTDSTRDDDTRADDARDHLLFELPEGTSDLVLAPRRYDAATGEPSVPREKAVSSLELRAPSLSVDVLLRPQFHDASFDALLDRLARGLASGGELTPLAADDHGAAALRALSTLYAEVRSHFAPARFELTGAAAQTEGMLAVFALNRSQRGSAREVARFELRLRRLDKVGWRVAAFENREAAQRGLDCRELEANLDARLARAHTARDAEVCNVLGLLIPGTCARADAALIERALSVRSRCQLPRWTRDEKLPTLPADFQLTLQRGRPDSGLDRHPRYVVTLFATGQVIFHGRHWVSTKERSDGRTARGLLASLYAQVLELAWFSRRADGPGEACAPSEQGDVITVRANGRERSVQDRAGCRGPFTEVELGELRRRIELIAGVEGWIAPRPSYADEHVEHWTLADVADGEAQ